MTNEHDTQKNEGQCCGAKQSCCSKKGRTDFRLIGLAVAVLVCAGLIGIYADKDGRVSQTIDSEVSQAIDSVSQVTQDVASADVDGTYEITNVEDVTDKYVSNIEPAAGDKDTTVAEESDVVVAEVNGKKIYRSEIMPMMEQAMQGQMAQLGLAKEQLFPLFVEQFVNGELVLQQAEKADIEQDDMYKKQLAMTEEQVKRNVFLVKMAEKQVTEDAMKKLYDEQVAALPDVPEIKASHILVKTEDEAKAVIKELEDGADFAALAKEKSTGPSGSKGGDLGFFGKEDMVPEFSEAAFKIQTGDFSKEPVKTQFGWHVIEVTDSRMRPKPSFEEVKPKLEEALRKEILDNYLTELRENADVALYDYNGNPVKENPAPAAGDADTQGEAK